MTHDTYTNAFLQVALELRLYHSDLSITQGSSSWEKTITFIQINQRGENGRLTLFEKNMAVVDVFTFLFFN